MNLESQPVPSLRQLHISTAVGLLVGAVVLVTTVLPAEYGIDPTGLGSRMNLTGMGELKLALTAPPTDIIPFAHADTKSVRLAPGAGTEVKVRMRQGDQLVFSWAATETVYFDFHGEPDVGGTFESYAQGSHYQKKMVSFEAGFTGVHGWYWKNEADSPVDVTVDVSGVFSDLRQH